MSLEEKTKKNQEKKLQLEEKAKKKEEDMLSYQKSVEELESAKIELKKKKALAKQQKSDLKAKPESNSSEKSEWLLFGRYHFNWNKTWFETYKFIDEKEGIKSVRVEIGRYTLIIPILFTLGFIAVFGV